VLVWAVFPGIAGAISQAGPNHTLVSRIARDGTLAIRLETLRVLSYYLLAVPVLDEAGQECLRSYGGKAMGR
jgi:hypothetical protein